MTALLNERSLKLAPLPAAKLNFLPPVGKTTGKRERIQERDESDEERTTGARSAIRPRKGGMRREGENNSLALVGVGGAVVLGVLALMAFSGSGGRAPVKPAEKPRANVEVASETTSTPELPAQPRPPKKTEADTAAEIAKIRELELKPAGVDNHGPDDVPAKPVVIPRLTAKQYMTAAMQDLSAGRRTAEAHENLVNALLQDERYPLALFEMARQLELDGDAVAACDFYRRAAVELARREEDDSQYNALRTAVMEKLEAFNRYGNEYTALLEEHARAITKIAAAYHDPATATAAQESADLLKLNDLLPADKRPKIEKVEVAAVKQMMSKPDPGPAKTEAVKPPEPVKPPPVETVTPPPATGVPLDVERALKAAGWTRVSGNWRKVSGEVYEVTDGKLEADKLSGQATVFVHDKGSTGSMKFVVRNCHFRRDYGTPMGGGGGGGGPDRYCTGYGVTVKDYEFKIYSPYTSSNRAEDYYPWMDHKVQGVGQRMLVRISCEEGPKSARLEILLNEKREKLNNYAIDKQGPFLLEVNGTMTIESPKAAGK
jgi:hypothetical protein